LTLLRFLYYVVLAGGQQTVDDVLHQAVLALGVLAHSGFLDLGRLGFEDASLQRGFGGVVLGLRLMLLLSEVTLFHFFHLFGDAT
jgi:hypothetical protein